jgi:hypothetical protein
MISETKPMSCMSELEIFTTICAIRNGVFETKHHYSMLTREYEHFSKNGVRKSARKTGEFGYLIL